MIYERSSLTPETRDVAGARTEATNRLECRGVNVRFGGLMALKDADLAVPPSAIVGLVGPNGAGKSTLFGVLSGLLQPTHGTVLMDGEDVTNTRAQLRARRGLARTFQHPELFYGLTVREHLILSYRVRNARGRVWSDLFMLGSLRPPEPGETAAVDELIDLVGLGSIAESPATGLPLGSARLVELGRALATSPKVLLLDEPSSGLDSGETEQFESALRAVAQDRGVSVLLVEHDVELVMRMCSTVYVLDFGAMIASGTPADVRANPAVRAAYLGEDTSAGELSTADAAAEPLVDVLSRAKPAAGAVAGSSKGLTVENLCVRYGDAVALSGVSFKVESGQVLAVLGPNGAGKSSLARSVSGLVRAHHGSVVLAGEDISHWHAYHIRQAGLIHLPEGRGVFRALTVMDNLRMAASTVPRQARKQAVELALSTFPVLASRRRQLAGSLSGGEQQMLSLARALAVSPQLIVADEMSLGLAPKMVDLVFESLARARDAGVTIIMVEQYVHRALAFADACLVLQRGTVAWAGPASEAGDAVLSRYLGEAMTATG